MRRLLIIAALTIGAVALADAILKNEGVVIGPVRDFNCVGPGIDCTRLNGTAILYVDAGTGGGVTAVTASAPLASSGGTAPDISITSPLPIANGGTNSTSTPTAGALAYGDGTAWKPMAAGTAGQIPVSAGAGVPVWTSVLTSDSGPAGYITRSCVATSNASTVSCYGFDTPSSFGTASSQPTAQGRVARRTTAATNGTSGGLGDASTEFRIDLGITYFSTRFNTGTSLAAMRTWAGITGAAIAGQTCGSGSNTVNHAAVCYENAVDSGKWQCCQGDGVTANCTSTGVTVATSTSYRVDINYDPSTNITSCSVNTTAVATSSSNSPTESGWYGYDVRSQTKENVSKTIEIGWYEVKHPR